MAEKQKILVVDDEPEIREVLQMMLSSEGYEITEACNAQEAVEKASGKDLVILDIMMPGESGIAACTKIREKNNVPILFLTAKSGEHDKVLGFSAGGDDYLVKPFELEELVARLNALCRRQGQYSAEKLRYGAYTLESSTYCLAYDERRVELRPREFKLLELLLRNRGQVMPAVLQDRIWGIDSDVTENNLDVHIRLLRKKIMELNGEELIKTMRGVGYYVE